MPLFKKREPAPEAPAWSPHVELELARPVIFALANAPAAKNEAAVRDAIARFVQLSERPSLDSALHLIQRDPDVLNRPWLWLAAVMREASASGDNHLAAAALFWACDWTTRLAPRCDIGGFMELELDPIPEPTRAEIAALGVSAASQLPADFVIVGDESGQILAGMLAETGTRMLGV